MALAFTNARPASTGMPDARETVDDSAAVAEEDRRRVVCAVELGWRISYLYADLSHPLHEAPSDPAPPLCLPAVETLPNGDQLELHFRAAASLAGRLRLEEHAAQLADLVGPAREAAARPQLRKRLLGELRAYHHALIKELWATREGEGKAYELGSSLFDTWNRLRLASARGSAALREEWPAVFDGARVERIKELLDDLQTRLDPAAVTVVKDHLDRWHGRVTAVAETNPGALPGAPRVLKAIRSQVVIWRQLVTRDKEPEAYLQREHRTSVRHEFNRLMWLSLRRPVPISCALIFAALVAAVVIDGAKASATTRALLPILAAIGLTQASLAVVARERMRVWSELLWNRALAKVVCDVTCLAEDVFPVGRRGGRCGARSAKSGAVRGVSVGSPRIVRSPPATRSPQATRSPLGSAAEL